MECEGVTISVPCLWQWDFDAYVTVSGFEPGDVVDFARQGSDNALAMGVDERGRAQVPNQLLTDAGSVLCWLRRGDETLGARSFSVAARPKPPDYAASQTEVMSLAAVRRELLDRIAAIAGGSAGALDVEPPLELDGNVLSVDLSGVRGTQVTTGDEAPTAAANRGDSYIRSNGELWAFTDVPGTAGRK